MAERLRPITVDGVRLRWRFDERLVVIPADRSGPQLYVEWGWRDWQEPEGAGSEPSIVTPRFVSEAVRFAFAHGWQPTKAGSSLRLEYQQDSFVVATAPP